MPRTLFVEPNVCLGENIVTDDAGQLWAQPFSVPRLVRDVRALSGGDGPMLPRIALPGKLMIEQRVEWRNDAPLEQQVMVRVIRGPRSLITSNPNALQFRDRWTWAVDAEPQPPITTLINGQFGAAIDIGTNSVAEPQPGRLWMWADVNAVDEWIPRPLRPGQTIRVWYRCYAWTPPPWSDNANANAPQHEARANWARVQLWAYPAQGTVVTG